MACRLSLLLLFVLILVQLNVSSAFLRPFFLNALMAKYNWLNNNWVTPAIMPPPSGPTNYFQDNQFADNIMEYDESDVDDISPAPALPQPITPSFRPAPGPPQMAAPLPQPAIQRKEAIAPMRATDAPRPAVRLATAQAVPRAQPVTQGKAAPARAPTVTRPAVRPATARAVQQPAQIVSDTRRVAVAASTAAATSANAVSAAIVAQSEKALLRTHNEYRKYFNLGTFRWDKVMAKEAEGFALQCQNRHSTDRRYAENIFFGQSDVISDATISAEEWYTERNNVSPEPDGHRRNLLNPSYTRIGCGMADKCGGLGKTRVVCRYI